MNRQDKINLEELSILRKETGSLLDLFPRYRKAITQENVHSKYIVVGQPIVVMISQSEASLQPIAVMIIQSEASLQPIAVMIIQSEAGLQNCYTGGRQVN